MKLFILFLLLISSLFARYDASPTKACQAFNNMKHTMNANHVVLDTSRTYTVLQVHKGQKLILVSGEVPAQRWVDAECFASPGQMQKEEIHKGSHTVIDKQPVDTQKEQITTRQNILVLTWHNAFCETHRQKKECQRSLFSFGKGKYKEKHFVLHGLWPQPKSNIYCGVSSYEKNLDKYGQWYRLPSLDLEPEFHNRLEKIMPGVSSNLHKHEWIKHGTCYSSSAAGYYEDAVTFTEEFNTSKVGQFFGKHLGQRVTLQQVRTLVDRSFGQGAGRRVEMKCKKGMVTELWLHLGSDADDLSTLLKRGKPARSDCKQGRIDKAGYNG